MAAVRRGIKDEEEAPGMAGGGLEDLEYILDDVRRALASLEQKRSKLQDQIAATSRGRRAHHRRGAPPVAADSAYTRKGAGAVRKRLRAAAGDVKKETERLEAVRGQLQEAAVDARERLALPRAGR